MKKKMIEVVFDEDGKPLYSSEILFIGKSGNPEMDISYLADDKSCKDEAYHFFCGFSVPKARFGVYTISVNGARDPVITLVRRFKIDGKDNRNNV